MGPQIALVTTTEATITWRTFEPVVGRVEGDAGVLEDAVATRDHVMHFQGLDAATTYAYRLLHDGVPVSSDGAFRTAPERGSPFRFAFIADHGTGEIIPVEQLELIDDFGADFVLVGGDNALPHGSRQDVITRYFYPLTDLLARAPVYPALGNHDVEADDAASFFELVSLPDNGTLSPERFYSLDWGDVHVVVLDYREFEEGSTQYEWLEADLARNGAPWTIVVIHKALYGASIPQGGIHPDYEAFVDLFDEHGVDFVLSGHRHLYERSHPLRGDAVVPAGEGTVYYIAGGGGQSLIEPDAPLYFTAFVRSVHHVLLIEVDEDVLTVTPVEHGGGAFDRVVYTRD